MRIQHLLQIGVLAALAVSVSSCADYETELTLHKSIDVAFSIDGDGSFQSMQALPLDDLLANVDTLKRAYVGVRSLDVRWEPKAGNSAKAVSFSVTSSLGQISSTQTFAGLNGPASLSYLYLTPESHALFQLSHHVGDDLVARRALYADSVGVRGTVGDGRAVGKLTVKVKLSIEATKCEEQVKVLAWMAGLNRC